MVNVLRSNRVSKHKNMEEAKTQAVKKLQDSSNVLVTVSSNPTVDQLAACIGFTLVLNKLGKHATAVFSGKVPKTIEFLKPEDTLENNTDSLRDFIISLDKSKADKLRYKVEDKVVKIYITPYRTSLSDQDLEFSQGDFNVDIVVALGVHEQKDLDQAITAHGRILHDATIVSVNRDIGGTLGAINWTDNTASSLCEMIVTVAEQLKSDILDEQIATALLTGIVAETQRFSNERTTSNTMNISARLMASGANQQLVATKLQEAKSHGIADQPHFDPLMINELAHDESAAKEDDVDGALRIDHAALNERSLPELTPSDILDSGPNEQAVYYAASPQPPAVGSPAYEPNKLILDPPTLGGTLTASHTGNALDQAIDPMSLQAANNQPILSHDAPAAQFPVKSSPAPEPQLPDLQSLLGPVGQPEPSKPANQQTQPAAPAEPPQTITDLEESVRSPHLESKPAEKAPVKQPPAIEAHPAANSFLSAPPDEEITSELDRPSSDPSASNPSAAEPLDDEEGIRAGGMHVIAPLPHTEKPLPPLPSLEPPTEPSAPAEPQPEPIVSSSQAEVISPTKDPGEIPDIPAPPDVDEARDAVLKAINATTDPTVGNAADTLVINDEDANPPAVEGLDMPADPATTFNPEAYSIEAAGVTGEEFKMPENLVDPNAPLPADPTAASVTDPTAPPPVPPPFTPLSPSSESPGDGSSGNQPPATNPFNLPPAA